MNPRALLRPILLAIGLLATGLGIVGIFLPLVPTVPLLLLAAFCFARSSEPFHNWLTGHPRLGPLINDFLSGQGVPLRSKLVALLLIWLSLGVTITFFIPLFWVKLLMIGIGLAVSGYLLQLPTATRP